MSSVNIYHFENAIDFLKASLIERKERNSGYTLSAWAKKLGYKNPGFLTNVLKGQRSISSALFTKLVIDLKLDDAKVFYFQTLVDLANAPDDERRAHYARLLSELRPVDNVIRLTPEIYKHIHEWHYSALLAMVKLADFREDIEYIYQKLSRRVSRARCKEALDRLKILGLLVYDHDKRLKGRDEVLWLCDAKTDVHYSVQSGFQPILHEHRKKGDTQKQYCTGVTIATNEKIFLEYAKKIQDLLVKMEESTPPGDANILVRLEGQAFIISD